MNRFFRDILVLFMAGIFLLAGCSSEGEYYYDDSETEEAAPADPDFYESEVYDYVDTQYDE